MTLKRQTQTKKKKKKVNLLGVFYNLAKGTQENYQKRNHPNRRRVKTGVGKRQAIKRIANNNQSTRGTQLK